MAWDVPSALTRTMLAYRTRADRVEVRSFDRTAVLPGGGALVRSTEPLARLALGRASAARAALMTTELRIVRKATVYKPLARLAGAVGVGLPELLESSR